MKDDTLLDLAKSNLLSAKLLYRFKETVSNLEISICKACDDEGE